jgi:P27 family predicted phage terminase small subunit
MLKAPKHLPKRARELWKKIQAEYSISDSPGLALLEEACSAYSRLRECQEILDREGLQIQDRFGQLRPHVLIQAERDSRSQLIQALKALNFDDEEIPQAGGRPPLLKRRK